MEINLIGEEVVNTKSKEHGKIIAQDDKSITVDFIFKTAKFVFPDAFFGALLLKNEELQRKIQGVGFATKFSNVLELYKNEVKKETGYLRTNGGKHYKAYDGSLIAKEGLKFIYAFDLEDELHLPEGTGITLYVRKEAIAFPVSFSVSILSIEDMTLTIVVSELLPTSLSEIEFSAEPWYLYEALIDRLSSMDEKEDRIAFELACMGKANVESNRGIMTGPNKAIDMVSTQPVTIVWGPPGTGKTTTLARIARKFIAEGKRVLLLSYSNVSVDNGIMRVKEQENFYPGTVLRYGFPLNEELKVSTKYSSYNFALHSDKKLFEKYISLREEKEKLSNKDPKRVEINSELKSIRAKVRDKEKEAIQNASFVATTVSKAVVDSAIYSQRFDLMIFDEASMALVPQIIYSASLAKEAVCILGDFKQLPAIVQNTECTLLKKDIFEFVGIKDAVEAGYGHRWLVMLDLQYRMHEAVADFVSKYMYEGLLKTSLNIIDKRQEIANLKPLDGEAMSLVDLSGMYSVCIKTGDMSRINLLSAMVSVRLAEMLAAKNHVAIITPYSAQSRLIFSMIKDLKERNPAYNNVRCATVHQFQGSESDIVIYDAVECYRIPFPGVLLTQKKDDQANRLFNVALTRTRGKFQAASP